MQDLSTFVAEVKSEGFVTAGEPNYALLHQAASSIQHILKGVISGHFIERSTSGHNRAVTNIEESDANGAEAFISLTADLQPDSLGYEYEFWRMLEDYPLSSTLSLEAPAGGWDWVGNL